MTSVRYAFREKFKPVCKETLQWYPGHMDKSFNKMQAKIKQVDCVLEVHDARIPFSGRNPNFVNRLVGQKPHILVLNKRDLVNNKTLATVRKNLQGEVEHVIFTNSKHQMCRGLNQLVPKAVELIGKAERFNRFEETHLRLMVIGVPNVGKSSLINALRNKILHRGKATAVGAIAGVTRAVQNEIKVHSNPPVYLVDTPGILPPRVGDTITGMKLALCSCLNDDVVGVIQMADFLLYWCNKYRHFSYVDYFELSEPCDNILNVLTMIATKQSKFKKSTDLETNSSVLIPDHQTAASLMVRAFRLGKLGNISLDLP